MVANSMIEVVTQLLGNLINNYIFNTKYIGEQRITQNNGICVDVLISCRSSTKYTNHVTKIITYYGILCESSRISSMKKIDSM